MRLGLGLGITAYQTIPVPPSIAAPTVYYDLNGNANDSSGNDFDATGSGAAYGAGKFAQGLTAGSATLTAQTATTQNIKTGTYSLAAWLCAHSTNLSQGIFSIVDGDFAGASLAVVSAVGVITTSVGIRDTDGNSVIFDAVSLTADTFNHVALVVTGSSAKLYVNGTLRQTISTAALNSQTFGTGQDIATAISFSGRTDECALWSGVALTAQNVADLYVSGLPLGSFTWT